MLPEAYGVLRAAGVRPCPIIAIIYTSLVALVQRRHEEDDCVLVRRAHGLCHAGYSSPPLSRVLRVRSSRCSRTVSSRPRCSFASVLCTTVCIRVKFHRYGGLANNMPKYAFAFMIFMLASVGLPGTAGFVGEFLVLLGTFQVNTWVSLLRPHRRDLGCGLHALSLSPRCVR